MLDRVRSVFTAALRLPPEQRDQFIEAACGADCALRIEVQELLDLDEAAGDFMNVPLPELMGASAYEQPDLAAGTLLQKPISHRGSHRPERIRDGVLRVR